MTERRPRWNRELRTGHEPTEGNARRDRPGGMIPIGPQQFAAYIQAIYACDDRLALDALARQIWTWHQAYADLAQLEDRIQRQRRQSVGRQEPNVP